MKTTKSRMLNIIIACSIVVNVVAITGLCYIGTVNVKTDRMTANLVSPVIIYAPKAVAKTATTAMTEVSSAK